MRLVFALLAALGAAPGASGQPASAAAPPAARLAADLREQVTSLPVTVTDLYGRTETVAIPLTIYRPAGDGPFPLAVVGHGRWTETRAQQTRARFELLARYLVSKGFAVFVPNRAGYGESAALFDPEDTGACSQKRYEPSVRAAADQLLATAAHARTLPWVDASRWIVVGQSAGGLAAMAAASRAPQGLAAAINFAGGHGGHPTERPGDPCSSHQLERLWRSLGATASLPVMWIYWTHDRFWGESLPRGWAQAWRDGGGRVELHQLPPWSSDPVDGHLGLERNMDRWVPLVEAHLAQAGFTRPGLVERPPPSRHATLDEIDKLPLAAPRAREQALERFKAAKTPRALAIGPTGHYGWASGDWALGRALGNCAAASGRPCRLYAVDDDVVWTP